MSKNKFVDDGEGIVIRGPDGKKVDPDAKGKKDDKGKDDKGKKKGALFQATVRLAAARPAGDPLRASLLEILKDEE